MRRKDAFDRDALHFAPFLLMPSPFPRQEFYRAKELQTVLNELMHKVAHDNDFLKETYGTLKTYITFAVVEPLRDKPGQTNTRAQN